MLCPSQGCGRKFPTQEDLTLHWKRRHKDNGEMPNATQLLDGDGSSFVISEQYILEMCEEEKLENITELVLRGKKIRSLSSPQLDVDSLLQLEVLSLSHNELRDVSCFGSLIALVELNLNFNEIEDLNGIEECVRLQKLWLSNNRIRSIEQLRFCTDLRTLSVYKNRIHDLESTTNTLKLIPNLKDLELEGNPCMRGAGSKYHIISELSLDRLDGQLVSQLDHELAVHFYQLAAPAKASELRSRPSTAPVKRSSGELGSMGSLLVSPGRPKQKSAANVLTLESYPEIDDDNQQSDESPKNRRDLSKELRALKDQVARLQAENALLTRDKKEIDELEKIVQSLKTENESLIRENANMYVVLEENNQYRRQLGTPSSQISESAAVAAEVTTTPKKDYNALLWDNHRLRSEHNDLKKLHEGLRVQMASMHPSLTPSLQRPHTADPSALSRQSKQAEMAAEVDLDAEIEQLLQRNADSLKQLKSDLRQTKKQVRASSAKGPRPSESAPVSVPVMAASSPRHSGELSLPPRPVAPPSPSTKPPLKPLASTVGAPASARLPSPSNRTDRVPSPLSASNILQRHGSM
eukprot:GILJ01008637.1.p1 GENE.GILJ01008637.1~~GILJ01008637.1.p1  ORF type:complete len:580 (-),score=102.91 GILJ01008637.1:96-1835(-)